MRPPQFIHSTTFHWALAVAGVLAIFVSMLFGFIYWKTDNYLIARSDRMTAGQMDIIAAVPDERRLYSIGQHLKEELPATFSMPDCSLRTVAGLAAISSRCRPSSRSMTVGFPGCRGRQGASDRTGESHHPGHREANAERGVAGAIGREVVEANKISHVVGLALGLGLLPGFCLCLLAGAWLSMRAQERIEEVNQRVQRIIAGDRRERLPHRSIDEPFSKLAIIVNGMLDEMETMIHALAGVGNVSPTMCRRR